VSEEVVSMGEREFIRVKKEVGLFEVTLDRPPLNILHGAMMEEITGAVREASQDPEVKLLLVRAEGRAFSAGADIDEHRPGKADAMIERFHGMIRAISAVPFPTVAFVEGAALGGGCELAIACDVVVASERAKLGQPEINLGFLPPVAAALLPFRVGWGRAVELCCTGRTVKAREALSMALVQAVFPDEGAGQALEGFLTPFLKQSPLTLRLVKKALQGGDSQLLDSRLRAAEKVFLGELMATQDVLEGLSAFDEKREPKWKNR
jgi:cyclohexa-1,5-dienecarbonyl-CoA hydratase